MADNPYPHLRHESTYFSDKIGKAENAVMSGIVGAAIGGVKLGAKGAWWLGKNIGKAGLAGASLLGMGAIKGGMQLSKWGYSSLNSTNPILNPVGTFLKASAKIGQKMVDYTPAERVYNTTRKEVVNKPASLKLSKFGTGVVLGGSILAGASAALNKFEASRLGTMDTKATTSTPDYTPQQYSRTVASSSPIDDGGATGDLVFALFKNRRGGSLL